MPLPLRGGLLSVGLVIDDLVCLDQVLTSDLAAIHAGKVRSEGGRRLEAALAAYEAAPLEVSPDKVFRDQVKASFWGATVCGASGWLKPNAHRLWPLVFIALRTIELGLATRHLLESLAGCWISVFILKRRFLAAMDLIFKACCAGSPNTILRLSPALRAELASFVVLGPLCSVNLRAQIDPTVSATDASSGWQAAVRAEIPASVAQEAYRHSVQKGAWTRLLSAPGAWLKEHGLLNVESELPGGEVFSALPLYLGLATCPKYTELWRKRYKSKVHMNVAELQAFLREEARAGHRKPDSRMIFGLDSQVCIGAVAKGRSASPKLNQLLCRSIPAVAGSQIQSVPIYFPSAFNPADDPTRDREVRPPGFSFESLRPEQPEGAHPRRAAGRWRCVGLPQRAKCWRHPVEDATTAPTHAELLLAGGGGHKLAFGCGLRRHTLQCSAQLFPFLAASG